MSALFIILVSLTMTRFSEKMLISTRCIHGSCPTWSKNLGLTLCEMLPQVSNKNDQLMYNKNGSSQICVQLGLIEITSPWFLCWCATMKKKEKFLKKPFYKNGVDEKSAFQGDFLRPLGHVMCWKGRFSIISFFKSCFLW